MGHGPAPQRSCSRSAPFSNAPDRRCRVVRNLLLSQAYTPAPASQKGLLVPIDDAEMNEISPQQVFAILSDDVDRCFELMSPTVGSAEEAEREYEESAVRSYVRAAFACMEGMTFCMRAWAAERVPEPQAEQHSSPEGESAPEQQGDLESSLTAMFTQVDQVMRIEPQLGTGRQWWSNLQKALELRQRLAHPRSWTDLAFTRDEILTIVDADAGFRLLLSRYLEVK
jgi:hypothetical protein